MFRECESIKAAMDLAEAFDKKIVSPEARTGLNGVIVSLETGIECMSFDVAALRLAAQAYRIRWSSELGTNALLERLKRINEGSHSSQDFERAKDFALRLHGVLVSREYLRQGREYSNSVTP